MSSIRAMLNRLRGMAAATHLLCWLLGACTELADGPSPDGGQRDGGTKQQEDDGAVSDDGSTPEPGADAGCTIACGPNERCIEEGADYVCRCASGYSSDGGACSSSTQCADLSCGPNQECVDAAGSPVCVCKSSSDCSSGAGTYCRDGASYDCAVDAQGCLFASAPRACPSGDDCESATCEPDVGCMLAAKAAGDSCGTGVCSATGECVDCIDNDDCDARVCIDGACLEPRCGDGIVTSPEECDPDAPGSVNDTWRCGPDCYTRTAYITCPDSPDQCDANASCQNGTSGRAQCLPLSGGELGGTPEDPADVCPALEGGYVQKLFSNAYCVIECSVASDCPAQLRSCIDNPFAGASVHEAYQYCVPP